MPSQAVGSVTGSAVLWQESSLREEPVDGNSGFPITETSFCDPGRAVRPAYLTLMIRHHEGALTMADRVLAEGTDVLVQQMAKEVLTVGRRSSGCATCCAAWRSETGPAA
ncbi:DUF305 domain-containing protein [uncultured Thermomonospora sp.]|uniref:DUF305 domain-containing protein n=1 Tax=uncultured Thermomonospora sp. TaxID=671175 RepID=UPI00259B0AA3|nr:DUF305 domain-containing protein [uncultured Thermomonospora sp.]